MHSADPFAKVRSLAGALIVLLGIRASARAVSYVVFRVVPLDDLEVLRVVDGVLLGLENLVTLIAMITFLVWIHRVFVAVRDNGGTTRWSPGMAVGGWFIPVANVVLPWLTVRDALRALERPTALAGAWWITWLLAMPLTALFGLWRQMMLVPEIGQNMPIELLEMLPKLFWPYFLLDTGTWVLLLLIVGSVRSAVAPRG